MHCAGWSIVSGAAFEGSGFEVLWGDGLQFMHQPDRSFEEARVSFIKVVVPNMSQILRFLRPTSDAFSLSRVSSVGYMP